MSVFDLKPPLPPTDIINDVYEEDSAGRMGFMYLRADGFAIWVGRIDGKITRAEADAVILRHNRGSRG